MGTIVTFYSYKGGVGRSMALANVAVLLARRGKKVLAIDWDLEAPGLPNYFADLGSRKEGLGLLPFLVSDGMKPKAASYKQYLERVENPSKGVALDLLSSGREADPGYSKRLEAFDWHTFFRKGGGIVFEELRSSWKKDYDAVLIDSRTGLTDSGGVCTILLPDVVVAMFTANNQSLYGVRDVMRLAQKSRQNLTVERMPLSVIPLACRFGSRSEFREAQKWLSDFAEVLVEFFAEWLPSNADPRSVLDKMKVPQVDYFSFGERLAVLESSSSDPEGMLPSFNILADLIESDLRNLDNLLIPERWTSGDQRPARLSIIEKQPSGADVFLSHGGDQRTVNWVQSVFRPELEGALQRVGGREFSIYFDYQEIATDDLADTESIKNARSLVALLTPKYFRNRLAREQLELFVQAQGDTTGLDRVFLVALENFDTDLLPVALHSRLLEHDAFLTLRQTGDSSAGSPRFLNAVSKLADSIVRVIDNIYALAAEYEQIRQIQPSGRRRTRAMSDLVARIGMALKREPLPDDLIRSFAFSERQGQRLVAIVAIRSHAFDKQWFDFILSVIARPWTPFEQFHALKYAVEKLPSMQTMEVQKLKTAINSAIRAGSISKSDLTRWEPAQDVLRRLSSGKKTTGSEPQVLE